MAEALLIHRAQELGKSLTVESAGIRALVDDPAHELTLELLAERGIDFSAHRARQFTEDMVKGFDLILVMDQGQKRYLEAKHPTARGRVQRLGQVGQFDVADPYKKDRVAFQRSLALIERGLDEMAAFIFGRPR